MTPTLTSLEDYLNTSYSPDREYVDGMVVERHMGERSHSIVQRNLLLYLQNVCHWLFVWPEQRLRTVTGLRSRVPDLCVTVEDPKVEVFEEPPLVCIEILFRRDEMSDLLEKLDEYVALGVSHVWVVDPRRRKAFTYSRASLEEVRTTSLQVPEHGIDLPLEEAFRGL